MLIRQLEGWLVVVVVIVLVKVTVKVTLRVVMSKSTSISLMIQYLTERQGQETSLHNKIILIV